jgi:hypothetical protein
MEWRSSLSGAGHKALLYKERRSVSPELTMECYSTVEA